METLRYYNAASKDVKINSAPSRNPDGSYKWSNGQEDILNQPQFDELRKHHSEIVQLETRKDTLSREMLMYQNPAAALEQEGEALAKVWQSEIDDEQLNLKGLKAELKQFDEDMFNRGHYIEEDKPSEMKPKESENKKKAGINWKVVFSFLGIWLIGEVFMTYVQWSALRDDKGIEDLAVRSLAFGVTLFLLHYVAHLNKKRTRIIYYVYMGFNLLMLLTMLFAPLAISKLYPVDASASSVQDAWSLTGNANAGNTTAITEYPFWVEFYRSYEVTPAILCFLFFVAMVSFMKPKPKETTVQATEPEVKPETVQDEIRKKRKHLQARIQESETRIDELRNKLIASLAPNTTHINNVLNKLESAKAEILAADNRITELKATIEALLKAVEKELNLYKTEYLDILRSDAIKSSFVTPEWHNRNDIIQHFKI